MGIAETLKQKADYEALQGQLKQIDQNEASKKAMDAAAEAVKKMNNPGYSSYATTLPVAVPEFKQWMDWNVTEASARKTIGAFVKRNPQFTTSPLVQDFQTYMGMLNKDPTAAMNGLQSVQNELSLQMGGRSMTEAKGIMAAMVRVLYPGQMKGQPTAPTEMARATRADKASTQQFAPGISGADVRARRVARDLAAWGNQ